MKNSIKKSPILLFFILTVFLVILLKLTMNFLHFSEFVNTIIAESFLIIILLVILKYLNLLDLFKFTINSFFKGILYGWYAIIICFILIATTFNEIIEFNPSVYTLLLIIVANLLIGSFEEILCRGIIFKNLLKKYTPLKSALISSLIFALAHIGNFFTNDNNLEVISQIIYAFFLGVLFSAIFYVTKNIWSVILLHALIDFSGSLSPNKSAPNLDIINMIINAFMSCLIVLPALFIGLMIFKKIKVSRVY